MNLRNSLAALIFVLLTMPAFAADRADSAACVGTDVNAAIAACTRLIEAKSSTPHERENAYTARGNAYQSNGNYDAALADYDAAIKLDPKDASVLVNRGRALEAKGDYDKAIDAENEAIKIDPKNRAAYVNLGSALASKGDYEKATAADDAAIKLDPNDAVAYFNRGTVFVALGKFVQATADFDKVVQFSPKYPAAYFSRGVANLYAGALPKAVADFTQAGALAPSDPYAALWLEIATQRSQQPSTLAKQAAQLDMTHWPAPVVRFYLGQIKEPELLAAADNSDPQVKRGQLCEANFYSGEAALLKGTKDDAEKLFRAAATDCPKSFNEWVAANAELRALGKH